MAVSLDIADLRARSSPQADVERLPGVTVLNLDDLRDWAARNGLDEAAARRALAPQLG